MEWLKSNKWLLLIAFFVFLTHAITVMFFWGVENHGVEPQGWYPFPMYQGDSAAFVFLADNLIQHQVFSSYRTSPLVPDTFRTPAYPLLLVAAKKIFGSYTWIVLFQELMRFGIAWLLFVIGRKMFSERIGFVLALLYVFDPLAIASSVALMSDYLFAFIFLLVTYFLLIKPILTDKPQSKIWISLLLGLGLGMCAMARPFALFFIPVMLILYFFSSLSALGWKKTSIAAAAMALGASFLIAPWIIRNHQVSGKWEFSNVGGIAAFYGLAPEYVSWKNNTSKEAAVAVLWAEATKRYGSDVAIDDSRLNIIVKDTIMEKPFTYAAFHIYKTLPFFISGAVRPMLLAARPEMFKPISVNLSNALFRADVRTVYGVLKNNIWLVLESIVRLLMLVLIPFALFSKKHKHLAWVLVMIVGAMALVCSPVPIVRYRVPVQPLILILDAMGIYVIYEKLSKVRA